MTQIARNNPTRDRLTITGRTATYLVRTPYSYRFHYAVPSDWHHLGPLREVVQVGHVHEKGGLKIAIIF